MSMRRLLTVLALCLGQSTAGWTSTWIEKASMPTPRMGLATSVVDGTIYAPRRG